jgi:hypothetical protein
MSNSEIQKTINRKVRETLKKQKPVCGDCAGFKEDKLLENCSTFCSKADKLSTSEICPSFAPSVRKLSGFTQKRAFSEFASILADVPDDALGALSAIIAVEASTRRAGFKFAQKVYVRYRGALKSNYLSNFMIAYVMYATPDHFRLISEDGRCALTFGANCKPNIYTTEQFAKLRAKMREAGKFLDPDVETLLDRRFRAEEGELRMVDESFQGNVTTIDSVVKENKIPRRKRKDTSTITTLVDIVAGVSQGFDMSKKADKYVSERTPKKKKAGDNTIISVSGMELE